MRLTFLGATHEVTGSCYYLEAAGKKFLVDCGMEQGPNIYENKPIPVPASQLDFVLITHAHIDHTGNLPLLYAHGFRGPIYMTPATVALSDIMLRDSAHIQLAEAEWRNRKNRRAGKEDYVTPYTMEDAIGVIRLLEGIPYHQRVTLSDGIQIRFLDAGHLLGSASIELWLTEDGVTKKLLFSGDIGNIHQPLINDPEYPESADYVIMESTYGDRSHGPKPDYVPELAKIIQETLDRGGNLVIPSFAVGRTQEMLYFIREIKAEHLVHGHGEFPVYVDSPLAVEATNIFRDHQKECYDSDAAALLAQGINPILFPGLKLSITSDESINTEITGDEAILEECDNIIIGCGAVPVTPPIPGIDGNNVISILDAHRDPSLIKGEKIVICGGGASGLDGALEIASEMGKKVSVVEMLPECGKDVFFINKITLFTKLAENGVELMTNAKVVSIEENGLIVEKQDKTTETVLADTVISAFGMKPVLTTVDAVKAKYHLKTRVVGDSNKLGKIGEAVRDGFYAATSL